MYCPSCGLQQTQDLRYCPRCGANLNPIVEKEAPPNVVGPIWAVAIALTLTTLGGLGFVFIFIMVLVSRDMAILGSHVLLIILVLLVVLAIAGLLVRQLSRLLSIYQKPAGQPKTSAGAGTGELTAAREAPQLEATRQYPISVTESTTRTFEPAPTEKQAKPGGN